MTDAEKRIHKRKAYHSKVIFEDEFGEGIFYVYSRDISEGGIFLECSIPAKIGSLLLMSFALPGRSEPIRTTGQVTRSQSMGDDADGIGVRFVGLHPQAIQVLQDFLR